MSLNPKARRIRRPCRAFDKNQCMPRRMRGIGQYSYGHTGSIRRTFMPSEPPHGAEKPAQFIAVT
jgi:hypothetical protein